MTNLDRKARCCRSDLRFLLSLLPVGTDAWHEVYELFEIANNYPTDEQINAAWQLAAIIHDEIRKAK